MKRTFGQLAENGRCEPNLVIGQDAANVGFQEIWGSLRCDRLQLFDQPCMQRTVGVPNMTYCMKLKCASLNRQSFVGNAKTPGIVLSGPSGQRHYKVRTFYD